MNKVLNFIKSHIKITVFLAIFLLIIVAGINFAYSIFTPKTLEGVSVSDLSTCQGTDLLNNSPAMQGTYAYIEPMGNRASFNGIVGHVFPVDHIYFAFNHVSPNDLESPTIETNVYAPADVEIYQITDKKYSVNNKTIQHDYLLYMAPCNGVEIRFDHIKTINQTLLESINNATSNCQNGSQGGGIEGSTITSCIFNVNVKVKSGEMIGVAGGAGSQQQSFDFGLYDTRMKPQSFVDPKIDGPYNLYAACPLYYYSDSIVKTNLFKSINNKQINSNGLPDCGTNMWDKS